MLISSAARSHVGTACGMQGRFWSLWFWIWDSELVDGEVMEVEVAVGELDLGIAFGLLFFFDIDAR